MGRSMVVVIGLGLVAGCGDSVATSATDGSTGAGGSTEAVVTGSGSSGGSSGASTSTSTSGVSATGSGTDTPTATGDPTGPQTGETTVEVTITGTSGADDTSSGGGSTTGTTGDGTTGDGTTGDDTTGDDTTGDGTTGEPPPEIGPFDVDDLEAGHGHACAVLHSGKVKCWGGYASSGDLGVGDIKPYGTMPGTMGDKLPFVDLGQGLLASAITSYYTGCAIVTGGKLKCWGDATFGALGSGAGAALGDEPGEMGDKLPFVDVGVGRTVKQVVAAVWTVCVVLDDDSAKCWGWNGNGWLGQGDKNDRGDGPNEMGDNLKPIALGAGRKVKKIALDNSHACALLDDATVKCWGQQTEGNLGNGLPGLGAVGDMPNEMGDNLPVIALGAGRTVKDLALGGRHACVILDNDKVKCWGSNEYGQLGLGDKQYRGDGPGEMGDALPYVDLGAGRTAVKISASYFHSCALLDNQDMKCWGHGAFGALGQGDTQHRGDDPGEMGDNLKPIALGAGRHAIKAVPGALYICALLDNHKVKCWGMGGEQGALGYEDMNARGDMPGEMGDALPYVNLGG